MLKYFKKFNVTKMNQLIENFDQEYNCVYLDADLRQSCLKGTKYQHVIEGQEFGHV